MLNAPSVRCYASEKVSQWNYCMTKDLQDSNSQVTVEMWRYPVQIGLGVWNFRLNLKNVCTDGIRQIFGNFCGDTAGRKVGDKSFAHSNALPLDNFV